jgi:hypothetical protein
MFRVTIKFYKYPEHIKKLTLNLFCSWWRVINLGFPLKHMDCFLFEAYIVFFPLNTLSLTRKNQLKGCYHENDTEIVEAPLVISHPHFFLFVLYFLYDICYLTYRNKHVGLLHLICLFILTQFTVWMWYYVSFCSPFALELCFRHKCNWCIILCAIWGDETQVQQDEEEANSHSRRVTNQTSVSGLFIVLTTHYFYIQIVLLLVFVGWFFK